MKNRIYGYIAILFIIAPLICSCGQSAENPGTTASAPAYTAGARTFTVAKTEISYTLSQTANVRARLVDSLYFDGVSGAISDIYSSAYDFVKKGDVIAELDPSEIQKNIAVSDIQKNIWSVKDQQQTLDEKNADLTLTSAKSAYDAAANAYDISPTAANKSALDAADIQYQYAQLNKQLIGYNRDLFNINYQDFLDSDERLRESVANCKMTAPDDGVLISFPALDTGEYADAGVPIFQFVSMSNILLMLVTDDAVYLKRESDITVTINGVSYAASGYAPQRGDAVWASDMPSNQLYLTFAGDAPQIIPGSSVTATISIDKTGILAIPKNCVKNTNGVTTVDVVTGGDSTNVPVKLGIMSGQYVEVLSGLNEGDTILIQ